MMSLKIESGRGKATRKDSGVKFLRVHLDGLDRNIIITQMGIRVKYTYPL